jgi:putative SOS response-associated peptidase YedK
MCGRFTLTTPAAALAEAFDLDETPALAPRYNVAPGQDVAVVGRRDASHRPRLALLHWGFRRPGESAGMLVNARSETAYRLPLFRDAFRSRRCLIPADGFYEWKREGARKSPYLIARHDGAPFALAGLWQREPGPAPRSTCVILTTEPNPLLREIHDRMPVIVPRAAYARWLDPELTAPEELRPLLVPFPDDELKLTRVGTWVNNARNDDPRCLEPA